MNFPIEFTLFSAAVAALESEGYVRWHVAYFYEGEDPSYSVECLFAPGTPEPEYAVPYGCGGSEICTLSPSRENLQEVLEECQKVFKPHLLKI